MPLPTNKVPTLLIDFAFWWFLIWTLSHSEPLCQRGLFSLGLTSGSCCSSLCIGISRRRAGRWWSIRSTSEGTLTWSTCRPEYLPSSSVEVELLPFLFAGALASGGSFGQALSSFELSDCCCPWSSGRRGHHPSLNSHSGFENRHCGFGPCIVISLLAYCTYHTWKNKEVINLLNQLNNSLTVVKLTFISLRL